MQAKKIIYVTGLPRSGSTLLCQLLGQHPEIFSSAQSSPLCHALDQLRRYLSDDSFLLAQLDSDFEGVYARLTGAFRGFLGGWFTDIDENWVVDKNRGWLGMVETVRYLDPDFRMLIAVRDLGQLYGSIEARHQETILLDFPDHLADRSRYARADSLFAPDGVIGRPLRALQSVQDLEPELTDRFFYVVFEDLVRDPGRVLNEIWSWLGLPSTEVDTAKLDLAAPESDSHYRFKYPHRVRPSVEPPAEHDVPDRIQRAIRRNYRWYYETFYPGLLGR